MGPSLNLTREGTSRPSLRSSLARALSLSLSLSLSCLAMWQRCWACGGPPMTRHLEDTATILTLNHSVHAALPYAVNLIGGALSSIDQSSYKKQDPP